MDRILDCRSNRSHHDKTVLYIVVDEKSNLSNLANKGNLNGIAPFASPACAVRCQVATGDSGQLFQQIIREYYLSVASEKRYNSNLTCSFY